MKGVLNRYHQSLNGSNHSFILFPITFLFIKRLGIHLEQFYISENSTTYKNQQFPVLLLVFLCLCFKLKNKHCK